MKSVSNASLTRLLTTSLLCALPTVACAVDFEGYTFDDDALAELESRDEPPEGTSERCIEFCDNQEEICGFGMEGTYESKSDCFALCSGYFDIELDCRENHLDFARSGPETHCPHTVEDGGGQCPDAQTTSCDRYCLRAEEACGFDEDDSGLFPNFGGCRDACEEFADNELECRFGELGRAEEGETERCLDLRPDAGTRCSDL